MIKVLIITNRFIYGGIEQLLLNLFEHYNNSEICFDLLTLVSEKDEKLVEKAESFGVRYRSLELEKNSKIQRQFYHYYKLYSIIKNEKYDVVHLNITNYVRAFDLAVAELAGTKVRIVHSHSANIRDSLPKKLQRPMRALYDFYATDFCACSDAAARYLFSRKTVREKKYQIITNGIDVKKYRYSEENRNIIRKELGIKDADLLIGHVGRFTEAKNHAFLLSVFNEMRMLNTTCWLMLVGDGELREDIKKRIRHLGLEESVILYGPSSNVGSILSAMDVFLFPSKWEGLGISAIEAQCNGLPCYVSENVPKSTLVTSNSMQLHTSLGAKKWAQTILETHRRTNEADKVIASGYDISTTVDQLRKIYRKSVDQVGGMR